MAELRKLYTANLDNEVVMYATDLRDFVMQLPGLIPEKYQRDYDYYKTEFLKSSVIPVPVDDVNVYTLQEVVNLEE